LEEEARDILRAVLYEKHGPPHDLAAAIRRRFANLGKVELLPPARDASRRHSTDDRACF
jgi:plasmid stability protein